MSDSMLFPPLSMSRQAGRAGVQGAAGGWLPALLLAALALTAVAPVMAAEPAVVAASGGDGVAACASCHGAGGEGMASFARLAGMNANYLYRQMEAIGDGSRNNPVMKPIVDALGVKGMREMADYYAALPLPAAPREVPGASSPGAGLALRGDWDRNIPGCVQCHGPRGTGVGDQFPAIAGQPAGYIVSQLKAWKDGSRKNDPLELMRHLSAQLSETEMRDVAAWFSGQSPKVAPASKESR